MRAGAVIRSNTVFMEHFKGKENPCIVISVYPLDILLIKEATDYLNNYKIFILTCNPQETVKIQGPRQ